MTVPENPSGGVLHARAVTPRGPRLSAPQVSAWAAAGRALGSLPDPPRVCALVLLCVSWDLDPRGPSGICGAVFTGAKGAASSRCLCPHASPAGALGLRAAVIDFPLPGLQTGDRAAGQRPSLPAGVSVSAAQRTPPGAAPGEPCGQAGQSQVRRGNLFSPSVGAPARSAQTGALGPPPSGEIHAWKPTGARKTRCRLTTVAPPGTTGRADLEPAPSHASPATLSASRAAGDRAHDLPEVTRPVGGGAGIDASANEGSAPDPSWRGAAALASGLQTPGQDGACGQGRGLPSSCPWPLGGLLALDLDPEPELGLTWEGTLGTLGRWSPQPRFSPRPRDSSSVGETMAVTFYLPLRWLLPRLHRCPRGRPEPRRLPDMAFAPVSKTIHQGA